MNRIVALIIVFLSGVAPFRAYAQTSELEDSFFALMTEFNSPLLKDRDAAEEELSRRFVEFEPIWQDRRFLTNGEVSFEARHRFEVVEARRRMEVASAARRAFTAQWRVESGETTYGKVDVSREAPIRIVYLTPEFDAFFWRDADGGVWRPVACRSAPEILPDSDDETIEIEAPIERVDSEISDASEQSSGSFTTLAGLDLREILIRVFADDQELTLKSGELTLRGATAQRLENGDWTVSFRLEYDFPFDAFDSHRVWFDKDDFALVCENKSEKIAPTRLRLRNRAANGVDVDLDFAEDVELDVALIAAQARLECRLPRFFAFLKISI